MFINSILSQGGLSNGKNNNLEYKMSLILKVFAEITCEIPFKKAYYRTTLILPPNEPSYYFRKPDDGASLPKYCSAF